MATLAGTTTNANTREHHEIHIKRGKEVKEEIGKRREIGDTETWTEAGVEVKDTKEKRKGIAIEAVIESIGVKNLIGDIMSMRTGRGGIDIERGLVLGESLETAQGHDQDLAIKGASGQVGLIWLHLVQWSFQELHYQCGRHPEPRGLFCLYTGVPTMGLIYNEDLIHLMSVDHLYSTTLFSGQLVGVPQTMPGVLPGTFPFAGTQFGTFTTMPMQAMTQQATRHARRVYVGGLPPLANEQKIATFFSQVMTAIGGNTAGPGDAVVNVYINHEKNFAFVEMRTVEEASNAMALDGIMFEGMSVRVRRPTDYNPSLAATLGPSQPSPHLNLAAVGLTPGIVGGADGPDKIFVGGLPYYLTEAQIKELLESFGPLRGFDLVKDRETGNSKGYAFCVYQDPAVTDVACAALNGLKMGDKTLTVRRATASGQPKPDQEIVILQAQQQIAIQRLALQATSASAMAFGGLPGLMSGLSTGLIPGTVGNGIAPTEVPTKVVCLTQLVAVDDLRDDSEFEDIYEDIKEECGKYGSIVKLVIPRPNATGKEVPGLGKAFVEYTDTEGSSKAKASLNGRKFAGNTVVAVYYPEDKFAAGEFGG